MSWIRNKTPNIMHHQHWLKPHNSWKTCSIRNTLSNFSPSCKKAMLSAVSAFSLIKKGLSPETQPWMSSLASVSMKVRMGELQHPGYPWPISKWRGEGQRVESLLKCQDITTKGHIPALSPLPAGLSEWCTGTGVIKKNSTAWLLLDTCRFTPQNALF